MRNPDLVSVIIPTYNRVNLLMEAVKSVRSQTWSYVQLIVVDDGSTDDTAIEMARMSDVCYIRQENRGQAAARNNGLRHAEGAYICSLDSDDIWEPDFLQTSIEALRTLSADFVFSNWLGQNQAGVRSVSYFEKRRAWDAYPETELKGWRIMEPQQARTVYIDACVSPSSAIVMRRDVLQHGWTEQFKIADDWCMLLDGVIEKQCRVAFNMTPRWFKRVVGDNIYDQRNYLDLRRDFFVHDYQLILKRFATRFTPKERALWHGRVAVNQWMMALSEGKRKRVRSAVGLLAQSARNLFYTYRYSRELGKETLRLMCKGQDNGLWLMKPTTTADGPVLEREG